MMTILDRKDLDDRTNVTLYNQVLQRCNVLSDKHVKEPLRVITVNESGTGTGAGVGAGAGMTEGAVGAPCSPHPQSVNARLWRHWLVGKTFKTTRHVSIAQCALRCRAIHRTRTVPSSLRYFAVDFT